MNSDLVGLAFAAGMVAAFNPCGFAMLPAYLTFVVQREGGTQAAAVGRALGATAAMALGFLAVFGSFGLLTVSVAARCSATCRYVTLVVGVSLVALGIWLLLGRELTVAARSGRGGGGRRRRGWDRCSATGSATRSRRCRARSARSWR